MHPDFYKRPLLWLVVSAILLLSFFYHPAPSKRDVFHSLPQKTVTLVGRVESFPVVRNNSHNVVVKVFLVDNIPAKGYVYARLSSEVEWKDTLIIHGKLQEPYGIDLPGNFNWRTYLSLKNIFVEIKSNDVSVYHRAPLLWRWIRALREDILQTFARSFPPELAAIAGGVLLGERSELSSDLYTAFQDSGAIHLLVASGGNVGFVTLMTLGLGYLLGLSRRKMLVIALVTAGIYTLVAGADAPLVRAYLMAVCACSGYYLGRNSGVLQGLILSCAIILVFHPAAVFETGFQMSFLATLAIVLCVTNYRLPARWPKAVRFFVQIFLATLVSQLALLPIFTNSFYKVSLVGLASNIILVPLASVLMVLCSAYYVLSLCHAGWLLLHPCGSILWIFKEIVIFFAHLPFSSVAVTAWNPGTVCAYYIALFYGLHGPQSMLARRLGKPLLVCGLLAWAAGYFYTAQNKVWLLSEWNKRAVLVRTANRQLFVFNEGFEAEKISRALQHIGFSTSTAEFVLGPKSENVLPYRWPGETWQFDKTEIISTWEKYLSKEGHRWEQKGYTGREPEGLSFCVHYKTSSVCVGEQARFVEINGAHFLRSERNQTVSAYW